MNGCCVKPEVTSHVTTVTTLENHNYRIEIVYCKNCGSKKVTSNIRHIK